MHKLSMQIVGMQNTHKIGEIPSIGYLRNFLHNLNKGLLTLLTSITICLSMQNLNLAV
jgi:hypothetical protein